MAAPPGPKPGRPHHREPHVDPPPGRPAGAASRPHRRRRPSSPPTTRSTPTRPTSASGWRSAPPGTAARRSTAPSTRTTSLATTQAICDYRAAHGIAGPLFLGAGTPTRCREPAWTTRARGAGRQRRPRRWSTPRDGYTPTPALSHAILRPQRRTAVDDPRRPTASCVTPVAQPAARRRLQVQPAGRRPRRHRHHRLGAGPRQRAPRATGLAGVQAGAARAGAGGGHHRRLRLPRRLRRRPPGTSSTSTRSAAPASASAPTRSAGRASTTGARSPSGTASTSPSSTRSSTRRGGS